MKVPVSEDSLIFGLLKNESSSKKQKQPKLKEKKHKQPMTPFDLDQTRERAFTENCWTQDSSTAAGLYIFINWWSEKDFEVIKRSKDWSVKETGAIYKHKFGHTDNPG